MLDFLAIRIYFVLAHASVFYAPITNIRCYFACYHVKKIDSASEGGGGTEMIRQFNEFEFYLSAVFFKDLFTLIFFWIFSLNENSNWNRDPSHAGMAPGDKIK